MRTDRLKEMLAIEGVEVKESWKKEKLVTQYVKAKREKAKLELAEHRATRRLESASSCRPTRTSSSAPSRQTWGPWTAAAT